MKPDDQPITVPRFAAMKEAGRKITMVTAYDHAMAGLVDAAGVEGVLVGDSLSMVVQGHANTLPVTLEEMIYHAEMVGRAVRHALVVVDMPFPSFHLGAHRAIESAGRILKDPTAQPERLCAAAHYLLHQTLSQTPDRERTVRGSSVPLVAGVDTLSITLSGLTDPHSIQTDLFARKPTLGPLLKSMDQRFPGRLLRPVLTHADPFFPEESYRFEPVCP